jgi:hypothetical protein
MEDFAEEKFKCPECELNTNVIWDPGQTSREIDCIHCRRDVVEMTPVQDINGEPVFTADKQGNPTQVFEPVHSKAGCRYTIERGKGVS